MIQMAPIILAVVNEIAAPIIPYSGMNWILKIINTQNVIIEFVIFVLILDIDAKKAAYSVV